MKGRDSYWDNADEASRRAKLDAYEAAKAQTFSRLIEQWTTAAKPVVAAQRREATEPKVSAPVAAYLTEWFER